jgi:hypothetical protein
MHPFLYVVIFEKINRINFELSYNKLCVEVTWTKIEFAWKILV